MGNPKSRLLLTGAGGFAAGNIIARAKTDTNIEIHAIEAHGVSATQDRLIWHTLDLRDSEAVREAFKRAEPEVVIHSAAISDIDYCEAHQEIAERVNVGATELLVSLCNDTKCRLIYFSSDSVFDGEKGNYSEEDQPNPLNFYARTKTRSENIIKQGSENWVIIRPSLILGFPVWEAGNSFLWRMMQSLRRGEQVAFPKSETRSPVDVLTLSDAILELASHSYSGILHLAGNTAASRFAMARRIAAKLQFPEHLVVDKKPTPVSGRAPRPRDVSLRNHLATTILKTTMLDLDEGIDRVIASRRGTKL